MISPPWVMSAARDQEWACLCYPKIPCKATYWTPAGFVPDSFFCHSGTALTQSVKPRHLSADLFRLVSTATVKRPNPTTGYESCAPFIEE
jgi:hypothetical protein